MIRIENDCVSCGLPCLGNSCRYSSVKHFYCDSCGGEVSQLYIVDSEELCESCAGCFDHVIGEDTESPSDPEDDWIDFEIDRMREESIF